MQLHVQLSGGPGLQPPPMHGLVWLGTGFERRRSRRFVCLFACTLCASSPIQTQIPSFVSLLRCQGSRVHAGDAAVLEEGGLAAFKAHVPRALHPASLSAVRACKSVVMGEC